MDQYGWGGPPGAARGAGAPAIDPVGATQRALAARRRRRAWIAGLWVLGLAVVTLAVVTVAVAVHKTTSAHHGSSGGGSRSAASTSSTSTPPPGAPVITALTPAQGSVGQVVVISGSNLMSADGQVLAHFGSVVAPTSCQSATSCSATVPSPSSPTPRVPVTVSTQAGTSNALNFTYA